MKNISDRYFDNIRGANIQKSWMQKKYFEFIDYKNRVLAPKRMKLDSNHDFFFKDKKSKVLELGSGRGEFLKYYGKENIIGVELSKRCVEELRKNGFEVIHHDLNETPLPIEESSFDCVYCSQVIEHLNKQQEIVQETWRILHDGGRAVFRTVDFNRYRKEFYYDYTHTRPFTKVALERIFLDNGFEVVKSGYGFSTTNRMYSIFLYMLTFFPYKVAKKINELFTHYWSPEIYVEAIKRETCK